MNAVSITSVIAFAPTVELVSQLESSALIRSSVFYLKRKSRPLMSASSCSEGDE